MPFAVATILTALAGLLPGLAMAKQPPLSACSLETFEPLSLENIQRISINVTASHNLSTSGRNGTGGAYAVHDPLGADVPTVDICQITLQYTHPGQQDFINTYIGFPLDAKDWNTRFLMHGGGGWYAGGESSILTPVLLGYASSSTDGGHDAHTSTEEWGQTADGEINWPALRDFSSDAIFEAAVLGKMATRMYYGSEATYSYWHGCSTGGRQGHAMAQEHPEVFDGIVAGAPAINWDQFVPASLWGSFVAHTLAAIAECDALDGVSDGIIAYPGCCRFDASSLVGREVDCTDPSGAITITKQMAELMTAMWEGPSSAYCEPLWYGYNYDASLTAMIGTNCTSVDNGTVLPFLLAEEWAKVFVVHNLSFSINDLTLEGYEQMFRQSVDQYASLIGTSNPDLSQMKRSGTKMLAWHGMADQYIPASGTIDYYERVTELDAHVADYYRLFMAPGVAHCGSGGGFDPADTVFDTLRAWVENNTVPDRLKSVAVAVGDTSATRTGYLCPYPLVFSYIGGDVNEASSFDCV